MIAPGIHYDIPMSRYLSGEGIPSPAISGSDLVNMATECPAYAWAFSRCNPDKIESEDTDATTLGTAAHCYILEPCVFRDRYAVKPEGMKLSTKAGMEWEKTTAAGREIISSKDFGRIQKMRDGVYSNPMSARILSAGGVAETTLIAQDKDTGLWLLSRPDLFIAKAGIGINLKTSRSPAPEAFRRSAASLRYDIGAALYCRVARLLGIPSPSYCFIVVGSERPHLSYPAAMSADAAAMADQQLEILIRKFADCVSRNSWPGYGEGIIDLAMPGYAATQIANNIQKELTA